MSGEPEEGVCVVGAPRGEGTTLAQRAQLRAVFAPGNVVNLTTEVCRNKKSFD